MTVVMIEIEIKHIVKSNKLLHTPFCDKKAKKNRSNPQSPLQKPEIQYQFLNPPDRPGRLCHKHTLRFIGDKNLLECA